MEGIENDEGRVVILNRSLGFRDGVFGMDCCDLAWVCAVGSAWSKPAGCALGIGSMAGCDAAFGCLDAPGVGPTLKTC